MAANTFQRKDERVLSGGVCVVCRLPSLVKALDLATMVCGGLPGAGDRCVVA